MNKRFTTVELPKPNSYGIMSDGEYLSTYQICHLLNDYSDKINNLEKVNKHLNGVKEEQSELIREIAQENDRLITKTAETISKHQQKILNLIDTKINEYQQYVEYDTEKGYIGTELLKELKKELSKWTDRCNNCKYYSKAFDEDKNQEEYCAINNPCFHNTCELFEEDSEPLYYKSNGLSPIQAFEQGLLSKEEYLGFIKGNIIKYITRAGKKTSNPLTDLEKAENYLQKLKKEI